MRNVYFDPFGSYASGMSKGLSDQQNLETNTRANRQADWNYFNINPIDLESKQLDLGVARYGQPFRMDAIKRGADAGDLALNNARMGFQTAYGLPQGFAQPAMDIYGNVSGLTMQPGATPGSYDYIDAQGRNVRSVQNPGESWLGNAMRPQVEAQADKTRLWDMQNRQAEYQNSTLQLAEYARQVQALQMQINAINAAKSGANGGLPMFDPNGWGGPNAAPAAPVGVSAPTNWGPVPAPQGYQIPVPAPVTQWPNLPPQWGRQ